ncbi:MAG: hypothetical protein OHK0056_20310 [Bacteriovoracaceae bacterium]
MDARKLIFTATLFLTLLTSQSEARPLKDIMGDMGGIFKQVARSISQGSAGAQELQKVQQLLTLVVEAKGELPSVILNSSSPQREEMTLRYESLMQDLEASVLELEDALNRGDSAQAKVALQKIVSIRSLGHDEFKI